MPQPVTTTTEHLDISTDLVSHSHGVQDGVPIDQFNHFRNRDGGNSTFTGTTLPNWKYLIRNGLPATTSASGVKFAVKKDRFFASYQRTRIAFPHFGEVLYYSEEGDLAISLPSPNFSPPQSVVSDVRNRCIRSFLDKAKSAQTSFESGQDIVEIKQTIESIIHPMRSIKELALGHLSRLKKAKTRYSRNVPSLKKALADSYLEFTFGWKPLASDVAAGIASLTNRDKMSSTQSISASATAPFDGSYNSSIRPGGSNIGFVRRAQKLTSLYTMRLKGAVRLNLVNGRIPLQSLLQLETLNDFAVTAWDIIPYSFIVDYFVNIGDVINSYTYNTSSLVWVNQTLRTTVRSDWSVMADGNTLDFDPTTYRVDDKTCSGGNSQTSAVVWSRAGIDPSSLVATLAFHMPISSKPWENIGALLAANSRGLRPFF